MAKVLLIIISIAFLGGSALLVGNQKVALGVIALFIGVSIMTKATDKFLFPPKK